MSEVIKRLLIQYSTFRTIDFFNKFTDEVSKILDIIDEPIEKIKTELETGQHDPYDFRSHTTFNCSVVLLVGAFEYLLEQIKQDKGNTRKLIGWDIESVNNWLKKSFSLKVTDLILKKDYRFLIIMFEYRHKVVHSIGRYDDPYIKKVKPLYEKIGRDTSHLIDGKNILLLPDDVLPMIEKTYELSCKIMNEIYPEVSIQNRFLHR